MSGGKNKAFRNDPVAFMRKYSVCVADDIQGNIGDRAVDMPTTASAEDYVFSTMDAGHSIAWLNFDKPHGTGANLVFGPKSEGSVIVSGSYAQQDGKVKSYFLPWTAGGGIINLSIPAMNALGNPNTDVKYFFTATITGCSVFIKGTAQAPVIYHAGGQTGQNNPANAAAFWQNLMNVHSGAGAVVGEVNKTDYVSQVGLGNPATPATAHSQAFEAWLQNNAPNDLDIDFTFPWGCIMGVRDDTTGDWTFYLQENVSIYYYKFTKKHWYSSSNNIKTNGIKGTLTARNRPMLFRQFFPGGLGHVHYQPALPRRLK